MRLTRPNLPKSQRKRVTGDGKALEELHAFLKGNEQWLTTSAMVGFIDTETGMVLIPKPRGPQKYIEFTQDKNNALMIPLLEAVSLFSSGRLVVCSGSPPKPLSGHRLYAYATQSIPFRTISLRQVFGRLSAVKAKPMQTEKKPVEMDINNPPKGSLLERIEKAQRLLPKEGTTSVDDIFKPSSLVKIPRGSGVPELAAVCLRNGVTTPSCGLPILLCLTERFMVEIHKGPDENIVSYN